MPGFCFGGFCLRLLAFWCGRLLEGKRIAEGELLASLKAKTLRKLKRIWDSAHLRTETLRVTHVRFLSTAVVCKSEHQGFKKAKETVQV
jgi:hypothetical protein